jgi:hypothetical protein
MRYDNSVGNCAADICELFADLFESVYNVDTCGSDTEDVSDPSDGCGNIRLRMSDLEVTPPLLNSALMGLRKKKKKKWDRSAR